MPWRAVGCSGGVRGGFERGAAASVVVANERLIGPLQQQLQQQQGGRWGSVVFGWRALRPPRVVFVKGCVSCNEFSHFTQTLFGLVGF